MSRQAMPNKLKLRPDESIHLLVRRSILVHYKHWTLSFLLIVSAAFFIYPLVQQGYWGIAVDAGLAAIGIFWFLRTYISWFFTFWAITDHRIVDNFRQGFFFQETAEAGYDQIEEVYGKKSGFINSLAGAGDIYLTLKGGRAKLKLANCRNYSGLISLIGERRDEQLRRLGSVRERKAQLLLLKIKNKVGEEKFNKLISD